MKRILLGFSTTLFLAAALSGAPLALTAQTTNKTNADKTAAGKTADSEKPAKGGPFHGKLAAVDKVAKTITVGKRTFQITSETKLKKAGKPATLDDGVVGETVSGYVKPAPDGKLMATTVTFGPKPVTDPTEKPKASGTTEQK
ncbi:MAG TPA: hypothetical protein VFE51_29525 [Verrucomicrobiae bacterium]|nr:hypothetical protein [Verrucomicrobiae bacterium]